MIRFQLLLRSSATCFIETQNNVPMTVHAIRPWCFTFRRIVAI